MTVRNNLRSNVCFVGLLSFAFLIASAMPVAAGKIKEYSADQVHMKGGKELHTQKLYVAPEKFRTEMPSPSGQGSMTVIFRQDKKLTWTVFPDKKMYVENVLNEEEMKKHMKDFKKDSVLKEEDLGTETVNGYKCQKKRVETSFKMMNRTINASTTVWKCDELDFPVRTQSDDGVTTELRNIKPASQPSELFEVPAGFQKTANMMEAFGMMDPAGGAAIPPGAGPGQQPPFKSPKDLQKLLQGQGQQPEEGEEDQ